MSQAYSTPSNPLLPIHSISLIEIEIQMEIGILIGITIKLKRKRLDQVNELQTQHDCFIQMIATPIFEQIKQLLGCLSVHCKEKETK